MITILQHSQYYVSFFVHLKNDTTFFNFVYRKKFKKSEVTKMYVPVL